MITLGNNEVTKAFLGSTEVKKICLGSKQVWPVETKTNYIMDGLVCWFDGINKGNDNTRWTDLIGGLYFTFNTYSSVIDNAVYMNGAGKLTGSTNMNFANSGTIECCVTRPNGAVTAACIFMPVSVNSLAFIVTGSGYAYKPAQSPANQYKTTRVANFTCSLNGARGMINGSVLTTRSGNNYNTNNSGYGTLGGRGGSPPYNLNGNIHSIRIYNRQLTEEEMLYNQQVDNERFNLGLTLPETI